MQLRIHPSVCTAYELYDLGEPVWVYHSADDGIRNNAPCASDVDRFKRLLREAIDNRRNSQASEVASNDWSYLKSKLFFKKNDPMFLSCIVAYTSTLQPKATSWLKKVGFEQSGPHLNEKYGSGLIVSVIGVRELAENIDWRCKWTKRRNPYNEEEIIPEGI